MKVVLIAKKKESECQSLMALTLLDLIFFYSGVSITELQPFAAQILQL